MPEKLHWVDNIRNAKEDEEDDEDDEEDDEDEDRMRSMMDDARTARPEETHCLARPTKVEPSMTFGKKPLN